jgi:hypothetical protein
MCYTNIPPNLIWKPKPLVCRNKNKVSFKSLINDFCLTIGLGMIRRTPAECSALQSEYFLTKLTHRHSTLSKVITLGIP